MGGPSRFVSVALQVVFFRALPPWASSQTRRTRFGELVCCGRDGKDSGFGFGLGLAVAMVLLALMGYMWRLGGRGRKLGPGNGASVPCWPLATCSCHLAQRAWRHLGQVKSGRMDGRR